MLVKDTHPAVRWVIADPVGSRAFGLVLLTAVLWFWEGDLSPWAASLQAALAMAGTEVLFAVIRVATGHSWRPKS